MFSNFGADLSDGESSPVDRVSLSTVTRNHEDSSGIGGGLQVLAPVDEEILARREFVVVPILGAAVDILGAFDVQKRPKTTPQVLLHEGVRMSRTIQNGAHIRSVC